MKTLKNAFLITTLLLLSGTSVLANQIPNDWFISVGEGQDSIQFVGYISNGGVIAQWEINNFDGTVSFTGTPGGTMEYPPLFDLAWRSPGPGLPVSVHITSNGPGLYTINPYYLMAGDVDPNLGYVRTDVSGDAYFGAYFPDAEQVNMALYLQEPTVEYDLTVTMEWGDGVPNEETSWGRIKSLFR